MSARTLPEGFPLLTAKAEIPSHVVYRVFAHETVVLNLETGRYHGLNPTGGRMLAALEREHSVNGAVIRLAEEYATPADEVERDVCEFCVDLFERGLIEISPNGRL
jgi:hypothetical protein